MKIISLLFILLLVLETQLVSKSKNSDIKLIKLINTKSIIICTGELNQNIVQCKTKLKGKLINFTTNIFDITKVNEYAVKSVLLKNDKIIYFLQKNKRP